MSGVQEDFHYDKNPLVADHIHGTRSFGVDKYGRLHGVTHALVWRPGVNEGVCRKSSKADHKAGSVDCECGFWAYFSGDNKFSDFTRISGIVRGSGTVTVGSKGFRAEKAEIVALVDPGYVPPPEPKPKVNDDKSLWDRFCIAVSSGGKVDKAGMFLCAGSFLLGLASLFIPGAIGLWLCVISFVISVGTWITWMIASDRGTSMYLFSDEYDDDERVVGTSPEEQKTIERFERVKTNYPDVPVYNTMEEAIADFPLITPAVHVPSPDDEGFWDLPSSGVITDPVNQPSITAGPFATGGVITASGMSIGAIYNNKNHSRSWNSTGLPSDVINGLMNYGLKADDIATVTDSQHHIDVGIRDGRAFCYSRSTGNLWETV